MRTLEIALAGFLHLLLYFLSVGVYLLTLYVAYLKGFLALLFTMAMPGFSTIYWAYALWEQTGIFLNPLTLACLVWLALLALVLVTASLVEGERV